MLDLLEGLCETVYCPTVLIRDIAAWEEFDGDESHVFRITIHKSPNHSDEFT